MEGVGALHTVCCVACTYNGFGADYVEIRNRNESRLKYFTCRVRTRARVFSRLGRKTRGCARIKRRRVRCRGGAFRRTRSRDL